MSAPTKTPTKAAQFADAAEALGWEVDRVRLPAPLEGGRLVRATRGKECYEFVWHRNERANLVFHSGEYFVGEEPGVEVTNVSQALRDMEKIRSATGHLLPLDLDTATPLEILEAVAGKHVKWTNSMSGLTEEGDVPRGGSNLRITESAKGNALHFTDVSGTGFRSFYVAQLTEVK